MAQSIHVTAGNHSGPKSQRGLDRYDTPAIAVEALLRVEPLPKELWDPCAGGGNIVDVLRSHGYRVAAHDLARDGIDFLQRHIVPRGVEAILTNPPFNQAAHFVQHGLRRVPRVIILERIQFLESQVRAELFDAGKLARIWVFRHRVPRMHREGWNGKRAAPAMCLAWFVFDRNHDGTPPTLGWI